MPEQQTFWAAFWTSLKGILSWMGRKLVAPGAALVVVIIAIVLIALGWKELQIGGILSALLGRKDPARKAVDTANSIPKGRVDANGNLIPIGQPDSGGNVQVQVVPIQEPGMFDDPTVVKVTPPGETKPVEVKLPDGVKSSDVEHVIIAQPDVVAVTVKDSSGVSATTVDDLLKKYSGGP